MKLLAKYKSGDDILDVLPKQSMAIGLDGKH